MLTPNDKLNRPNGNRIIQIEITRKCDLFNCSNCTRLLPFRGKAGLEHDPWEMSLGVFERAVASLAGWPGVVALFGGNPCTHSKFSEICRILAESVPMTQRGLWTNNLRGHGAVVRETFAPQGGDGPHGVFNLNVHCSVDAAAEMREWLPGIHVFGERPSQHGQVIGSREDLGVSEADWIAARERCDINQHWSAAIVERNGAASVYFCEVAAAIDGMTGQDHGLPAEPGWWQRPIADFEQQIHGCCDRHCVVPLRLAGGTDTDDTYQVTKSFVGLDEIKLSPKVKLAVVEQPGEQCRELTDYQRLRT